MGVPFASISGVWAIQSNRSMQHGNNEHERNEFSMLLPKHTPTLRVKRAFMLYVLGLCLWHKSHFDFFASEEKINNQFGSSDSILENSIHWLKCYLHLDDWMAFALLCFLLGKATELSCGMAQPNMMNNKFSSNHIFSFDSSTKKIFQFSNRW